MVRVRKYCETMPLYRQSQMFGRSGVEIERSILANWVGGACWWLEPLQARVAAHVFGSAKIFADDTPIPVLDPGRGRLIMLYLARQSAATRRPAAPTGKNHAHEAARGQRHVPR